VLKAVVFVLMSYLWGAIPTGYLIAKQLKGIDIREHGSGNVGATNVGRVVGKKAGWTTLGLDFLKGVIPVLAATMLFPKVMDPYQVVPVLAALAAIIGHSKSIYIGFKGGKSVITFLGTIIALEPVAATIVATIAVTTIKITRYVSVGSMLGALLIPIAVWLHFGLYHGVLSHVFYATFAAVYIIMLHRSNIDRLLKHQENRL
jgi:acyl phosphate:glycerol-3-phosphate acyltransferase